MDKSHLLLPVDTTDLDETLVEDLTKLFQPEAFTLSILHVTAIPDMTWRDYDDIVNDTQETSHVETIDKANEETAPEYNQQAKRLEELLLKELAATQTSFEAKGFEVDCNIAFGEAVKEIVQFAESKDADLIIMSKHNRKSLPRLNMGSVTESVLKMATVPVLQLRPSVAVQETS